MNAEAIVAVSAAIVALTQLAKWAGLQGRYAPLVVMGMALLGVTGWAWDQGGVVRGMFFSYFAGWISVTLTAAGVFGFVREGTSAVTEMRKPTWKPGDEDRRTINGGTR